MQPGGLGLGPPLRLGTPPLEPPEALPRISPTADTLDWPPFLTWLLYGRGTIFNFLHTKNIFRENIVRTGTFACIQPTKNGSVGI